MRCKVGDICIVVKSEQGNTGRIVEVIRPYVPDEIFTTTCGLKIMRKNKNVDWIVKVVGEPLNCRPTFLDGSPRVTLKATEGAFADTSLKPLRGSPDWKGTTTTRKRKAPKRVAA